MRNILANRPLYFGQNNIKPFMPTILLADMQHKTSQFNKSNNSSYSPGLAEAIVVLIGLKLLAIKWCIKKLLESDKNDTNLLNSKDDDNINHIEGCAVK